MSGMINIKSKGYERLMRQMGVLVLSNKELKELSGLTARGVMKAVKQNIKAERSPDGTPWPGRSSKSGKKGRMLKKMTTSKTGMRRLALLGVDADSATLGWKNTITAQIAYGHQYGYDYTVDWLGNESPSPFGDHAKIHTYAEKLAANKEARKEKIRQKSMSARQNRRAGTGSRAPYDKPATDRQAKALAMLVRYRYPARGKESQRRSMAWITKNLKFGQAGAILFSCGYSHNDLEKLTGDVNPKKTKAKMPARPFLGVSEAASAQIKQEAFEQLKLKIENA